MSVATRNLECYRNVTQVVRHYDSMCYSSVKVSDTFTSVTLPLKLTCKSKCYSKSCGSVTESVTAM